MSSGLLDRSRPRRPKGVSRAQRWLQHRAKKLGSAFRLVSLQTVFHHDYLYQVYLDLEDEGGPAPGTDGISYADLTHQEAGKILKPLAVELQRLSVLPAQPRSVQIRKILSTEMRGLNLPILMDRVTAKGLAVAVEPTLDRQFLNGSWAYRKGRSAWRMLSDVMYQMAQTNQCVLAINDVKKCFDNVRVDQVLGALRELLAADATASPSSLGNNDLDLFLSAVEIVLRGPNHDRTIGIDQGNNLSTHCVNALLHFAHDIHFETMSDPLWWRYSDNLIYATKSVSKGNQVLARVRHLLKPYGLELKGEDGVLDIRKGDIAQIMGFALRIEGKRFRIGLTSKALAQLEEYLKEAHRNVNPSQAAHMSVLG